jgi:hypothetical protein
MEKEELTADCLPPVNETLNMASTKPSKSKSVDVSFTGNDQQEVVS